MLHKRMNGQRASRFRRGAVVALVTLVPACDRDGTDPPREARSAGHVGLEGTVDAAPPSTPPPETPAPPAPPAPPPGAPDPETIAAAFDLAAADPVGVPEGSDLVVARSWSQLGSAIRSRRLVRLEGDAIARRPIRIEPGVRSLVLQFTGKVIWDGRDTMEGLIQIEPGAGPVTVDGLHLVMADAERRCSGVQTRHREGRPWPRGLTVRRCELLGPSHGLLLEGGGADFVRVEHNRFEGCKKYGVFASGRIENLMVVGNRMSIDPEVGIEHTLRLYDLHGHTRIIGNELENRMVHRNADGIVFQKTNMWILEAPGEAVIVEGNRFLGGLVQLGGGGDVGGQLPLRNVILRRNRFEHELVGTAIQFSGGVFGGLVEENVITTPRRVWMYLSGMSDRERARTPCERIRWNDNHVNGRWVSGWDGIDARPREGLRECGPEEE
jgi:hypothetical protein